MRLGNLAASPYYFIDMELCDLNLEDYIYRDPDLPIQSSVPRFVKAAPSDVKVLQIWNIMKEITGGVDFIHDKNEVHRDLKPSNSTVHAYMTKQTVLYSRKHLAWKIADFGFATQGTSQTMHTSKARGTSSYRAPELLTEDRHRFSNKVDIWSLGCILYELAVGQKAFNSDIAVFYHKMTGIKLEVKLDESFNEDGKRCIMDSIARMLEIEGSARPSASALCTRFSQYCKDLRSLPTSHGIQLVVT
jgi:serine/threonine protein kinase